MMLPRLPFSLLFLLRLLPRFSPPQQPSHKKMFSSSCFQHSWRSKRTSNVSLATKLLRFPVSTPTLPFRSQSLISSSKALALLTLTIYRLARRPVCLSEEPVVYPIKVEIEAMFKQECERAFIASTSVDLKPPYLDKRAPKKYF